MASTEVDLQAAWPAKIIESFFPLSEEGGPGIIKIAQVLKRQGVSKSHLCQALAIIVGIMSSRLGDPVPMILTEDEGAGALDLLNACLNLVPEEVWVEAKLAKALKKDGNVCAGKTIICYEADSAHELLSQILLETEMRSAVVPTRGQMNQSKPASFVAITKNPNHALLQNRYVTRIHINSDVESKSSRLSSLVNRSGVARQREYKLESACLRKFLRRIRPYHVDVGFADKVVKEGAVKVQNIVPFVDGMLRILRNIVRINNPPPICMEELQAAFLDMDPEDLISSITSNADQMFIATKADYQYYLMVFGGMLMADNNFLSPRQLAIYNVIFKQNIEYTRQFTSSRNDTPEQIVNKYAEDNFSRGWATIDDIMQSLSEFQEQFSRSTLHKELQFLLKNELIRSMRVPRKPNKFAYATARLLATESMIETDLSKIVDPSFSQPIEIYHFLAEKLIKI